ncbi:hypothetical protein IAI58_03715 [Roseomonas marmotae]|uniref:Uncharacterized protein n=2 Tax=Roseomonas marmotae TaxID=2768161 RepID=A0ABS3KC76_9PROT|nr:DUF6481 family protein [Roseomonas marmotae]MBO1075067.1 hypothetical protein [Roseomonas marmotae]QTI80807.1 hypothetical protein IAI58_03715 [Roseomonas marmotae]
MISHKSDSFNDRLAAASKAKEAMLQRFRARPGPNDPALLEQQAQRKAVSEARDARNAAKKILRDAEAARLAAEKAADAERQKVLAAEQAAEAEAAAQRAAALPALQKAARDARYAARQARRR